MFECMHDSDISTLMYLLCAQLNKFECIIYMIIFFACSIMKQKYVPDKNCMPKLSECMHANDIPTFTYLLCTKLNTFKHEELQKTRVKIFENP